MNLGGWQVVRFGQGGNKGQPAREIIDNPCADHFILLQMGSVNPRWIVELSACVTPAKRHASLAGLSVLSSWLKAQHGLQECTVMRGSWLAVLLQIWATPC